MRRKLARILAGLAAVVRLDGGRVTFANSHVVQQPVLLNAAVAFFFWWMPHVFGKSDGVR